MAQALLLSLPGSQQLDGRRAFVDFDERVLAGHPGAVILRAPLEVHGPLLAHAARRLRATGYVAVSAACRSGAPLFREVATMLGIASLPSDPSASAEAIVAVALERRAAIVAPAPNEGTWDHAVATELARAQRILLVLAVEKEGKLPEYAESTAYDVAGELASSDRLRWLSAVAEEAQTDLFAHDLVALEGWWSKARRVAPGGSPSLDTLSATARAMFTLLALAGRSLRESVVMSTVAGADAALEELAAASLVERTSGIVSLAVQNVSVVEAAATAEERRATAKLLAEVDADAWALARAAELFVAAESFEDADACIAQAVRRSVDGEAAGEIARRWHSIVSPVGGQGGFMLHLRAAERALAVGEAADAQRWCEGASALAPEDPAVLMLMGRSLMLLGDLVSSRIALSKAKVLAQGSEERARVAAELAELSYTAGDHDACAEHAKRTLELAETVGTRLAARSTLGKLLLAAGRWDEADEHFADDALTASAAGEVAAELRARLNRGIALMSKVRLDEARAVLEKVLEDGTRLGEDRACAFALANLGVVAHRQRDYGKALGYWDRVIKYPQALRGRMMSALTMASLAELRLRLGLVDHAEHLIAFGRRVLGGSAPALSSSHFKEVAAQIALVRGQIDVARREIEGAIVDAQISRDQEYLEDALNVAARVALEDGDLARAEQFIVRAESVPCPRAETTLVRALYLRARGDNALPAAEAALDLARSAGDEDRLTEIYSLLAILHRDAGDLAPARTFCARAISIRDRIASTLPADVAMAFLAKAESRALSRLQASLANTEAGTVESEEYAARAQRAPTLAPDLGREIVGDDPQMKNLLAAIRKVARASSTILIRGESGTGKELVAEALHRASDRASGPLVSVNCAALVETLLLSELFGHEKGAFTGASVRRRGRFELAEGGTLFLDEIGDISPRTQVALLRVLQEKTFERVGGAQSIRANVRVICATHRDLRAMVERGEFREDLYYRLRGITLEVPALRARLGDLPKIAEHLLDRIALERGQKAKQLGPEAGELLRRHRWPGNVRELENVLRAVSLFVEGDTISVTDLIEHVDDMRALAQSFPQSAPMSIRSALLAGDGESSESVNEPSATEVAFAQVRRGGISLSDMKRQIERDCILRALSETGGNITRAAALLGMKRPRLSQLVKQYGLAAAPEENA